MMPDNALEIGKEAEQVYHRIIVIGAAARDSILI